LQIKTLFVFLFIFTGIAICGLPTVFVEYRNGESETVKKAAFKETAYFRTKGRSIEINPKKLGKIDIFADTIEIYYGETWVRAHIYPVSKDSVPPVYYGFVKINAILTGIADFGKLSASVSELRHINFKPKKAVAADDTVVNTETEADENPDDDNTSENQDEQQ
jgi:hypothetical protein